jgi:gamma-glutamylcyclotransferase (GGCT)/AIG2-like uncharacterized protein YtfP
MPEQPAAPPPSPASTQTRHVFVYGTLRRGGSNDITKFTPAPRYVGQASLPGVMYHLGPYPGVLLGGDCMVYGEVYAISAELENKLDVLEELSPEPTGEYFKREVLLTPTPLTSESEQDPGTARPPVLSCIVYEINPERVVGRATLTTGDWIKSTAVPEMLDQARATRT